MATTLRQRNAPSTQSKKERRDSDVLSTSSDEDTSPASHLENSFPPFEVPNFTIKEVLGAIPAECFERSAAISFAYVARDFALVAALGYAASFIDPAFGSKGDTLNGWAGFAAKWASWALYWTVQGWVMTGIWILGTSFSRPLFRLPLAVTDSLVSTGHECMLESVIALFDL
jgi:omega-6 fatty acid desaturase (delta-12 desaturase)